MLLVLTAQVTRAEVPLSAEVFEERVTGRTLTYGNASGPYGAEQYLSNRRVRWSYLDGECIEGQWFVDLDLICFVYDNNPEPQCWSFYDRNGRLTALFENDPNDTTLYEVEDSDEPLMCQGPEIGV